MHLSVIRTAVEDHVVALALLDVDHRHLGAEEGSHLDLQFAVEELHLIHQGGGVLHPHTVVDIAVRGLLQT